MLAKLNGHKDFLVKISVLLVLLVLGRGLKEAPVADRKITQTRASELASPLVITTSFKTHFFPTGELASTLK